MTVSDHVENFPFRNTQDWTGGMGISPSGRFRVVEESRTRAVVFSRQGIRGDCAKLILMALAGLMVVILLADMAALGAGEIRIRKLNNRIDALEERNEALQAALTLSGGDISVCTEAVKLNLVSSSGVKPIALTAPTGAKLVLVESGEETDTAEMRAAAMGTQGD